MPCKVSWQICTFEFSFLFYPVHSCLPRAYIITHRSLNIFSCLMQRRKPKLVEKKATTLFKLVNNRHATCSKWKRRRYFVKVLSFIKSTLAYSFRFPGECTREFSRKPNGTTDVSNDASYDSGLVSLIICLRVLTFLMLFEVQWFNTYGIGDRYCSLFVTYFYQPMWEYFL